MNRILGKFIVVLMLMLPTISMSAVDILVSTDRNPVQVDESFQLIFEANGSVDAAPDFAPLKVLLNIIRQSENSSISIINGSMSRSKTWTLTVMPKAMGDIQIPTIHFGDDKSGPILIKVKKAEPVKIGDSSFFITLSSDVSSSVEQAQIIVTIRVFSDKSLNEISLSSLQFNHSDIVVETLGDEKSYQTKIQGKGYLVIEQKAALFPQKPGPLVVQPVLALAEVRIGNRTFFGDPASQPVRARSDSLTIDVEAKPASATTWLPATALTLTDEWLSDPSQFTVGEPITRVLTVKVDGLTAAQLPELDIKEIDSVKLYPDQDVLKNNLSELGVSGIRQEKIAYIPSVSGVIKLPAKEINWWNTTTKKWEKAHVQEQIITVKPSELLLEQAPIKTHQKPVHLDNAVLEVDADMLSLRNDKLSDEDNVWKWLALCFAIAWFITLLLLLKKRPIKSKVVIEKPLKRAVFKMSDLKIACESSDVSACKAAVIDWANARYSEVNFTQITDLKTCVSDDLFKFLEQLEVMLYAKSKNIDYDFSGLLTAITIESKKQKKQPYNDIKKLKSFHLS